MSQRVYSLTNEQIEERTDLFLKVLECLWRYNDAEKKAVAEEAGCCWTTLYFWCSGRTTHPRIDTMSPVAKALGYRVVLKRDVKLPTPKRGLRVVK